MCAERLNCDLHMLSDNKLVGSADPRPMYDVRLIGLTLTETTETIDREPPPPSSQYWGTIKSHDRVIGKTHIHKA